MRKFLLIALCFMGCSDWDLGRQAPMFGNVLVENNENNPTHDETNPEFCGICLSYMIYGDPSGYIYFTLESCDYIGGNFEQRDDTCFRKDTRCYADCLNSRHPCTGPTESVWCEE